MQKKSTKATMSLKTILDEAKEIAQKSDDTANAMQPLIEKLVPLLEKIGVAALWVSKLWL